MIIIPFIFFTLILYVNYKIKKDVYSSSMFLLTVYWLMALSAIIYDIFSEYFYYNNIPLSFYSIIYLLFALSFYIIPFIKFNEKKFDSILISNQALINVMSVMLIILSFISIVFFIPSTLHALSGDIGQNRIDQVGGIKFVTIGILNTISGSVATLYPITIILFFISVIQKKSKIFSVLLLISSTSYIFFNLSYVGRDGPLFWSMMFLFNYLFFKDFIPASLKKLYFRYANFIFIFSIIVFVIITYARFGDKQFPIVLAFVDYMGQQIKNFSDTFQHHSLTTGGYVSFGWIVNSFNFLSGTDYSSLDMFFLETAKIDLLNRDIRSWNFGTFIKQFYYDYGFWGPIIIGIFFAVLMSFLRISSDRIINLEKIVLYSLYFQIVAQGVFYFKQYGPSGNAYIVFCFLLAIIIKLMRSKKNQIVLKRLDEKK